MVEEILLLPDPHLSGERAQAAHGGLRFSPEVNLGALIQAAIVLVALIAWGVTASVRSDQTQRDVVQLRIETGAPAKELRDVITGQITELRGELRGIADQRARLELLERGAAEQDRRDASARNQLDEVTARVNDLRAAVGTINGQIGGTVAEQLDSLGLRLNRPLRPR